MHKLTTKQRLSVQFGSYVFGFIVIMAIAVYYFFQAVIISEIKNQSIYIANEIIKNFISINSEALSLRQKEQTNLEEELAETNTSALLFDTSLKVLFGHGNFSFFTGQDTESAKKIISLAKKTLESSQLTSSKLLWRNQEMFITAVPVLNGSTLYGVIIIGKPIASITKLNNTLLLSFILFSVSSFIGSVILGNIIVRNALKPIQDLTKTIHSINLETLTSAKQIPGPANDEIVQLVNKFNTMVERIRGMSQQQKDFISNASHELKTPISSIISSLELLSLDAPSHVEKLNELQEKLFSISTLLDQLMQLSKLQSGIVPISENIPIESTISHILKQYHKEIEKKQLLVQQQISQSETIPLPKEYAVLLFSNIISNGIKYSYPKTTLSISLSDSNNHIHIAITNHGPGMTENEISHIFDKFYRGHEAKRQAKGYGIGLSIVERICEIYNIKISISSVKDSHTTVQLSFKKSV